MMNYDDSAGRWFSLRLCLSVVGGREGLDEGCQ